MDSQTPELPPPQAFTTSNGGVISAALVDRYPEYKHDCVTPLHPEDVVRTAIAAAVQKERETNAMKCDEIADIAWGHWELTADPTAQGESNGAENCAAAIRARADGGE